MKTLKLVILLPFIMALPFAASVSASDQHHGYYGQNSHNAFLKGYKKGYKKGLKKGKNRGFRKGYDEGLHGSDENPELGITIWFFSFNNPELCSDTRAFDFNQSNCFVNDIFNPAVETAGIHLTGGVAKPNGDITLAGTMYEKPARTPLDPRIEGAQNGLGLEDGMNSEVALIVRSHGIVVAPRPDDQLIQLISPSCSLVGGDRNCVDLYWATFPVGTTESPVYDIVAEINNPTGNPEIFGCSRIYRYDGAVSVVVHTNVKYEKTDWLKETCGLES